jgi:hypothetical protein
MDTGWALAFAARARRWWCYCCCIVLGATTGAVRFEKARQFGSECTVGWRRRPKGAWADARAVKLENVVRASGKECRRLTNCAGRPGADSTVSLSSFEHPRFALANALELCATFLWSYTPKMSSYDIAEEIRESLPGTEELFVQYLSGYLVDDAGEDEDILAVARYMLESVAIGKEAVLEPLMAKLADLLGGLLSTREGRRGGPKLQRLDKVLDMSKTGAMSSTIAFAEGVDLESINKGKCVACPFFGLCVLMAV